MYVGLDVHARKIAGCVLNTDGKRVREFKLRGGVGRLLMELRRLNEPCRMCYEASCDYGHLFDRLAKLPSVERIAVAHPGQLRLIFRSKKKHDRYAIVAIRVRQAVMYVYELRPVCLLARRNVIDNGARSSNKHDRYCSIDSSHRDSAS